MKRLSILLLSMLMLLSAVVPAAASNDIKVIVDGIVVNFDVQPQIIDGRTMVPLRAIFEALGATVNWNESTKTITANKGDLFVKCAIGSYSMDTSSGTKTIDVPPTIINSRTLVPARFIAEGFNCDVQWDAANRRVTITSAPVEYVIVEHGDKKDEQKDNTVKQDNNNSEENEDTDKNDNTVKNTDNGDYSLSAFDKLVTYLKAVGVKEEDSFLGVSYQYKKSTEDENIYIKYFDNEESISFDWSDGSYSFGVSLHNKDKEYEGIFSYKENTLVSMSITKKGISGKYSMSWYHGRYTTSSWPDKFRTTGDVDISTYDVVEMAKIIYPKFNNLLKEMGFDIKLSDLDKFLVAD